MVTRLRLDANLFAPAPPRRKGTQGRPPVEGKRLPKLTKTIEDTATVWTPHRVVLWYGKVDRAIETATGTAVRYHGGLPPVPIRWMNDLAADNRIAPRATAWYRKTRLTFSDAIAAVRRETWKHQTSSIFRSSPDSIQTPAHVWARTETTVAHAR